MCVVILESDQILTTTNVPLFLLMQELWKGNRKSEVGRYV